MASSSGKKPEVSVVIPSHNRVELLERAVRSVLAQSFEDFEIIVVDDCSSENICALVDRLADKRITCIRHETNLGAQAARNTGIKAAEGKYVAFLDSDDEYFPDSLASRLELANKEGLEVIHSDCLVVRAGGLQSPYGVRPLAGNIYDQVLAEPGPLFPALLVAKSALQHIGLLDESIISWQEWDTAIRLARHFEFGFIDAPTFIYHCEHQETTISRNQLRTATGYKQVFYNHESEIMAALGREGLARHYVRLAGYYSTAGEKKMAVASYARAFRYRPFDPEALRVALQAGLSLAKRVRKWARAAL